MSSDAHTDVQARLAELEAREAELVRALERRDLDLIKAQRQLRDLRDSFVALEQEYASSLQLARKVQESITWNAFQSLRSRLFAAVGGEDSRAAEAIQSTLRRLGAHARGRYGHKPPTARSRWLSSLSSRRLEFPESQNPDVSIVIPVYRRSDLTRRCLRSILEHTSGVDYEVILVDDQSDQANQRLLGSVTGVRLMSNPDNLGYLRSVNRGAAAARGRWLVLANNDIEVQPGWLQALLGCGQSAEDIAVVTPKYLYPTGYLNEAGGIIWSDGTGVNYGRGDVPDSWRYGYRRDVDYGSAAALLVRTDFWRQRGGYDETFMPMYYEDTDLCFDARERGLRVVYEPEAVVIHHEGGTAGTDPDSGHKRHQEENRHKFVAKWGRRLEDHPPPGRMASPGRLRRGPRPHVLIVDHRIPTPDRDSGSLRMQTIIEILRELDCQVTLIPDNRHHIHPYGERLARLGVAIIHGPVDLKAELRELGTTVDLAFLSRPEVASRWLPDISQAAPQAATVYDTVDLHWLREARKYWHELGIDPEREVGAGEADIGPEATVSRAEELSLVRATDITVVVSEVERELVAADVPGADVRVIPNIHRVRESVPPHSMRSDLLFVGGFEHTPNTEAALRLVNRVMPLIWRERPNLTVLIVGPDPPAEVLALNSEQVKVTGWVPNLDALLDSTLAMLAPLSYGAGIKGKVTQAMAAGLPVVTTPTGAEGIGATSGQHLLVAEDDPGLAAAGLRLLDDPLLWDQLSASGRELIAERFSVEAVRTRLVELLRSASTRAAEPPLALQPSSAASSEVS